MSYDVKLEVYEGPFDLLLDLISKQKVDIYDVPIAQITNEYLAYLERARELDLEVTSEFLLIAATLLGIKAAGLLIEKDDDEIEEELSPLEVKEALVARLLEYKHFKNAALSLTSRLEVEKKFFMREADLEERFVKLSPNFPESAEPEDLAKYLCRLLSKLNVALVDSGHILSIPVSLDEKIDYVLDALKALNKTSFTSLTDKSSNRAEIVVIFLALLELFKRGEIVINQARTFGEIEVTAIKAAAN